MISFSPDGGSIAFNRIFRNFELRKRYVGGQQQDIYTYDFQAKRLTRLTDWKGTDTSPMWAGGKIYVLSDRGAGFRANIWVHDLNTGLSGQITRFTDYDADWPSLGAGGIAFQQGGELAAVRAGRSFAVLSARPVSISASGTTRWPSMGANCMGPRRR